MMKPISVWKQELADGWTALEEARQEADEKFREAEQQLEEKMDRWVYLNDLAEKIEAQQKNGQE